MKNRLLSLLIAFAVISAAQAKQIFKSTTVVQIHPAVIEIPQAGNSSNPALLLTRNYMENEFESIIAQETLKIAAQTLKIDLKTDQEALKTLRSKITTKPRHGTDFIEITAADSSQKEAKRVVEAVTSAYIKRRTDADLARAKIALDALDQELIARSNLVAGHRKELTKLIQHYGIPYFEDGNATPLGLTEQEMLTEAKEKLAQFEVMRDQIEIQIKKLVELTDDKLFIYAASLDLPENKIADHYIKYQEARTEKLALFDQGLNFKDPKVKASGDRAEKLLENAEKEVVTLKEALATKLELVIRQVVRIGKMVYSKGHFSDLNFSLVQNQYNQAKETYEQSRAMLREMKIKQQEARVLLKMPRNPVTIHERAK